MSNAWIELGLSRPDREKGTPVVATPQGESWDPSPLVWLATELLRLLEVSLPQGSELESTEFRAQLQAFSLRLLESRDITRDLCEECLAACRAFYERAQSHLAERETEFSELMRMLGDMMTTLDGSSASFTAQLDRSAERLTRMVDINDIRILKRRLALEVEALKKLGIEKRGADEALRSTFTDEIERLQVRLAQSMEEASLDQLTKIANRGRFERTLRQWVLAHRTSGLPFVLAMVDVDNFKDINDGFGHPEGDRVLSEIARTLAGGVRATDLVARYGGDEFVVMLAHSTAAQAQTRITTLTEQLANIRIGGAPDGPHLTLSVGATEWSVDDEPEEMISRADTAMYQAKRGGKNRVEILRRATRSKLFHNGRPVASAEPDAAEQAPLPLRKAR
jgi:diguanylate cyclase (GGDEF)-like protein